MRVLSHVRALYVAKRNATTQYRQYHAGCEPQNSHSYPKIFRQATNKQAFMPKSPCSLGKKEAMKQGEKRIEINERRCPHQ